nr:PREDICTED: uncharacterized protein LOC106705001 [Latimeria chalumnae]|eukprot:XP_014348758.1 PREDICTED: uncharacterized protein LOC106705001 [Latimeria chalumnae]
MVHQQKSESTSPSGSKTSNGWNIMKTKMPRCASTAELFQPWQDTVAGTKHRYSSSKVLFPKGVAVPITTLSGTSAVCFAPPEGSWLLSRQVCPHTVGPCSLTTWSWVYQPVSSHSSWPATSLSEVEPPPSCESALTNGISQCAVPATQLVGRAYQFLTWFSLLTPATRRRNRISTAFNPGMDPSFTTIS